MRFYWLARVSVRSWKEGRIMSVASCIRLSNFPGLCRVRTFHVPMFIQPLLGFARTLGLSRDRHSCVNYFPIGGCIFPVAIYSRIHCWGPTFTCIMLSSISFTVHSFLWDNTWWGPWLFHGGWLHDLITPWLHPWCAPHLADRHWSHWLLCCHYSASSAGKTSSTGVKTTLVLPHYLTPDDVRIATTTSPLIQVWCTHV